MNGDGHLDHSIIEDLIHMFDEVNPIVQVFCLARDRINNSNQVRVNIRLIESRASSSRSYALPLESEVASLIVGDFDQSDVGRDIIVEHKNEGYKRISDEHPLFMSLQYPILFPYGQDGFHPKIPYFTNCGKRKTKLLQQFMSDAYTSIEGERLSYYILNQHKFKSALFKNITDAVVRGDTIAASIGKRIILHATFTGGLRYMIQNYQDAMTIRRHYENPNLFINFTANEKWPEIQYMLDEIPGQHIEDRPNIVSRVFKLKLEQLMDVLIKGQHFGRVIAGD
ncbi:hypothetical protein REPUB_Repub14bG0055600 [Reevesia pubescens]